MEEQEKSILEAILEDEPLLSKDQAKSIARTHLGSMTIGDEDMNNVPITSQGEEVVQRNENSKIRRLKEIILIIESFTQKQNAPVTRSAKFRKEVKNVYNDCCAISGLKSSRINSIEAAHVVPFSENGPDTVNNGVFLRHDLHTLFDSGLLHINEHYEAIFSQEIINEEDYSSLNGKKIFIPKEEKNRIKSEYLESHRMRLKKLIDVKAKPNKPKKLRKTKKK